MKQNETNPNGQPMRLVAGGVLLVAAIIFGMIFWNQFAANQQQLAGGEVAGTSTVVHHPSHSAAPLQPAN